MKDSTKAFMFFISVILIAMIVKLIVTAFIYKPSLTIAEYDELKNNCIKLGGEVLKPNTKHGPSAPGTNIMCIKDGIQFSLERSSK